MNRYLVDPFNAFTHWWDNETIHGYMGETFPNPEEIKDLVGLADAPVEVSDSSKADISVLLLESESRATKYYQVVNKGEPTNETIWF